MESSDIDNTVIPPEDVQPTIGARRAASRVVLASIGAVATCVDTAEEQFDRFVSRGEEIREEVQERSEDAKRQNWRVRARARDYFRGTMDMVLDTFNVPSRTDVDTINVKLNILTRKLDDLQMQASSTPRGGKSTPTAPPAVEVPPATGDLTT